MNVNYITKDIESASQKMQEQQTIVNQLDALRAETQKLEAIYQQKFSNFAELEKCWGRPTCLPQP